MKIAGIVAEYNPFHNGHLKQLRHIKNNLKPDYTIVIMSGNFTQRGDVALLDKYTRASHAILGGADLVLELPQVFACQNAEVFSKGALSILSKLPGEKTLCFGAEKDNLEDFINLAKVLNNFLTLPASSITSYSSETVTASVISSSDKLNFASKDFISNCFNI